MCIDVCLTAYAHYYQAIENLPCKDKGYKITTEGKQWFAANS